jgi:Acetyltransferase (GNAT) family.
MSHPGAAHPRRRQRCRSDDRTSRLAGGSWRMRRSARRPAASRNWRRNARSRAEPQLGHATDAGGGAELPEEGTVMRWNLVELKRPARGRYFGFPQLPAPRPSMSKSLPALEISRMDPREPEAAALIRAMTAEVTKIYDHKIDGAGNFKPEDVLVPGSGFLVGRVGTQVVACGGFRPLEPGIAEIKRMFVAPEHRGRGYSKAILGTLERMARRAATPPCAWRRVRYRQRRSRSTRRRAIYVFPIMACTRASRAASATKKCSGQRQRSDESRSGNKMRAFEVQPRGSAPHVLPGCTCICT